MWHLKETQLKSELIKDYFAETNVKPGDESCSKSFNSITVYRLLAIGQWVQFQMVTVCELDESLTNTPRGVAILVNSGQMDG